MKSKRYKNEQIIGFLKAHESGIRIGDLVRQLGFSEQSLYRWNSKFCGSGTRQVDVG
jgi:putative transposase